MAESRVQNVDLRRGQQGGGDRENMSVVVGQLRHRLSVAVVRATANCLITCVHGSGGKGGQQKEAVEGQGGDGHEAGEGSPVA